MRTIKSSHCAGVALGILASGLMIASCGPNNSLSSVIKDLTLATEQRGTDQWVTLTTSFTGNLYFTGINLPVSDPHDPTKVYGSLTLLPNLNGGGGDLMLAANLTTLAQAKSVSAMLPNGTPIPVAGLQNANIIGVPVGTTGTLVYLAFGPGVALLGTAIPFKALDSAGKYVPGIDIFQPITIGKVAAMAGVFGGYDTKTTGVGVFVDLSSVINQPEMSFARAAAADGSGEFNDALVMQPVENNPKESVNFLRRLYELSRKNRLEITQ